MTYQVVKRVGGEKRKRFLGGGAAFPTGLPLSRPQMGPEGHRKRKRKTTRGPAEVGRDGRLKKR